MTLKYKLSSVAISIFFINTIYAADFPCDPPPSGLATLNTAQNVYPRLTKFAVSVEKNTPHLTNTKDLTSFSAGFVHPGPIGAPRPPLDFQHPTEPPPLRPDSLPQLVDPEKFAKLYWYQREEQNPKLIFDTQTKITLGNLWKPDPSILRQSDPKSAIDEAKKRSVLKLSDSEHERIESSATCSKAFDTLLTTFESQKTKIGFWTDETNNNLANFINWYYQSDLPKENRDKAAPIIKAQKKYEQACLEKTIPTEINPALIQQAVGLLSFENKVFCTALRLSKNEILTTKHCFLSPDNGTHLEDVIAALENKGQIWFTYEAEPSNRFGICKTSLPKATFKSFGPESDNVKLRISTTNAPVAPLRWASSKKDGGPLEDGTSLYLRGYFPFTETASTDLERLRSTAVGGCFAHSIAGRCFFHACQTTPIMSGAPIFIRPEPGIQRNLLEVAGIHIGSAPLSNPIGKNGPVCSGADGTKVPLSNLAYQP
ncbi:trypsin-like serine peptidase [Azotobacter chroococcum]|uniref:trypsin-like serine peptidase n=1 Tax=Azotobacter chroococcum TaxID=353 RepID=UPI0012FD8301|nr:hypothetical protein [Azotobacter chroococcum]